MAGEAKRGKSTLVNALLGRDLLPSGVTPLTAVTTTVRYGDDERAEARFLDGHEEKYPLAALGDLVTERGNPGNRRRIAGVTVYATGPVLEGGVELVDTPGTGSVFEWDTQAAHEALESMDAAVFVLTADPPVSATERDLLGRVAGLSVTTFAVLNKADHLDEPGLAEAVEFIRAGRAEIPSRAYVAAFGFKGSDQQKPAGLMSGGERGRVNLALTLKQGGNLLLLDEPANDLDVETLASLENALDEFPGCAVITSHDRWFLDRVATHILAWEGGRAGTGSRATSPPTSRTSSAG